MSRARLIGLAAALLALTASLQAQSPPSVSWVYPVEAQIVGGTNVLLYAGSSDLADTLSVVFDVSLDGVNWTPLVLRSAPDFGLGSYTTGVDLTQFPVGAIYFRARFFTDSTGPVIAVQNRVLPVASCKVARLSALTSRFDCSASTDSNGGIVSYAFHFGDGTTTVSGSPTVTHSYPSFGIFPLDVTVTDSVGLSSTEYKQLLHLQVDLIQNRPACSCGKMTLSTTGNSTLPDPRRFGLPMPMGDDPVFLSNNFQITATLTADSDPALCTEGQQAKGSSGFAGFATEFKGVCTSGNTNLLKCSVGPQCDFPVGAGNGVCTLYPNLPASPRGNDDYRSPFDQGIKEYVPPNKLVWIDAVGMSQIRQGFLVANAAPQFNQNGDFLAFVKHSFLGGTDCSCHFTVNTIWAGGSYAFPGTFIDLINDGETQNCVLQ